MKAISKHVGKSGTVFTGSSLPPIKMNKTERDAKITEANVHHFSAYGKEFGTVCGKSLLHCTHHERHSARLVKPSLQMCA